MMLMTEKQLSNLKKVSEEIKSILGDYLEDRLKKVSEEIKSILGDYLEDREIKIEIESGSEGDEVVTRILIAKNRSDDKCAEVAYSDDLGQTWVMVDVGSVVGQYCPHPHCLFAIDNQNIWMTTQDGYIYKSEDAGLTWMVRDDGVIHAGTYTEIISYSSKMLIFPTDTGGFAFTKDSGATWSLIEL